MSDVDDGGAAFPTMCEDDDFEPQCGMSLRAYLAAHERTHLAEIAIVLDQKGLQFSTASLQQIAEACAVVRLVKVDALIAALKQPGPHT